MDLNQICATFRSREAVAYRSACRELISSISGSRTDPHDLADIAASLAASGKIVSLPKDLRPIGDVPSTGGPGSLTTLLCPLLLATVGVHVPKVSATGSVAGAIDTMAMIPGYRYSLETAEFIRCLRRSGFGHSIQTEEFCPADRVLIDERRRCGMMANVSLAAVSLLAKKAAIPGIVTTFDFRVGPAGNICRHADEGREAAAIFLEVADLLSIDIAVVLTDNRTFPSSALGRLESLFVLFQILTGDAGLSELDRQHREACIHVAAVCAGLCWDDRDVEKWADRMRTAIADGRAFKLLMKHLECQGASERAFRDVLQLRARSVPETIYARETGYWVPPPMNVAKDAFKDLQRKVDGSAARSDPATQIGVRLVAIPGAWVLPGDPVCELRYPEFAKPLVEDNLRSVLGGEIRDSECEQVPQVIDTLLPRH